MEQEQFERIEALFHAAMELPAGDRRAFIRAECGDDIAAVEQLERMLRFEERPDVSVAMHRGVADVVGDSPGLNREGNDDDPLIGRDVGDYHIVSRLGVGGFGDVYLAEQLRPVQRRVAMKIIRAQVGASRVLARFETERQALAVMDHPNIASIFDAGETGASLGARPYVVMELVEGPTITRFCDERRLGLNERIELFLQVCRGVQHAHQKGVIHRDLKPSNVVVAEHDGRPLPKIIDFGIAKAIDQPIGSAAAVTEARQMIGTPQYMSPEQAAGAAAVDTRTDIYSLGAMLYELLTGAPPLDTAKVKSASFAELQQMLRDRAPGRPSTRFGARTGQTAEAASSRGADPAALRRLLRGELDWIVMKALEHDPARRYSSASEFAADLERFLRHEPVLAGPPSATYRVRKFIRRHRAGVVAACAATIALIVGMIGLSIGLIRANESAAEARAVNEFMHDVLTSVDPDREGADVRLVEVLAAASESVPARFADQPDQQATLRMLLADVYVGLGMAAETAAQLEEAVALYRDRHGEYDPRTLNARRNLAHALMNLGRFDEAEAMLEDQAVRDAAVHGEHSAEAIDTNRAQALMKMVRGDSTESAASLRQVLHRATDHLERDHPVRLSTIGSLLRVLRNRIDSTGVGQARDEALEGYELAAEYVETLRRSKDVRSIDLLDAMVMRARFCYYTNRFEECVSISQSVLDEAGGRFDQCHWIVVVTTFGLCRAQYRLGEYQQSAQSALETVKCAPATSGQIDPVRLGALSDALPFLDAGGRFEEGEQFARELVEAFESLAGSGHGSALNYRIFLGRFLSRQGRFDEADEQFRTVLEQDDLLSSDMFRAQLHLYYGRHLCDQGRFDQAEQEMSRAVELAGGLYEGTYIHDPHDVIRELIVLYKLWNRPDRAEHYRRLLREAGDPAI